MSRIDFVTGAPEKYAHLVDALATVPDRLRRAVAAQPSSALATVPDRLRRAVAAQPSSALGQPDAAGWSVERVIAHMAVYAHANGVFVHRMVTMTDPEREDFNEDEAASAYAQTDAAALLDQFEREIGQTVDFLSETPDAAWGRPGRIRGLRRSVRQHVALHINHMDEHITQVETLLRPE